MPKMIVTHEVDDVTYWLVSSKREEVVAGVATEITTYVRPGDPDRVGLSMNIADMDAFEAIVKSEAGADAMRHDGARPETLVRYLEG